MIDYDDLILVDDDGYGDDDGLSKAELEFEINTLRHNLDILYQENCKLRRELYTMDKLKVVHELSQLINDNMDAIEFPLIASYLTH